MTFRCHSVCELCVNFQGPVAFRKLRSSFFSQSANRWKMQNFDQIVNERYQKKWFILCFTKKLRDFEIISVSSLFRFNYNIINLLFLKSYFIINSAYLNAQIIWNDMKNEIKYRRRNVSFISLYFFFFFISNLTDYNIVSWQKRGKGIEIDAINY